MPTKKRPSKNDKPVKPLKDECDDNTPPPRFYDLSEIISQNVTTDWKDILLKIVHDNPEMTKTIEDTLNTDKADWKEKFKIFPPKPLIFNAFNQFDFNQTNAVIMGQDPYHGTGQAMGLSFSVPKGTKTPPSLVNIYKELVTDIKDFKTPNHGDLTVWAQQGILLLNSALTVLESSPNEYQSQWTPLTDKIIEYLDQNCKTPVIYLLWGNNAKQKKKLLKNGNSLTLESAHPSPLSAKRWFGNKHFSQTNQLLKDSKKPEINWLL